MLLRGQSSLSGGRSPQSKRRPKQSPDNKHWREEIASFAGFLAIAYSS
jgi:hypothetical protein